MNQRAWMAVALMLLMMAGMSCGGSEDSVTGPSPTTLRILLTDAPTDELAEVNVYITGLTVKRSGSPVERISNDVGLVDLLSLRNGLMLLVAAQVEPGNYEFIRVELDQDQSFVVELGSGTELPLQIASEEVKVNGGFTMPAGGITSVTLDFDAEASLRKKGNGNWLLTPIILMVDVSTTG